jgi:large subunit ribosomal protein L21
MYAIIKTGAKQYRVRKGDVIEVELIDATVGETVDIREVLYIGEDGDTAQGSTGRVGAPYVANAHVKAEFVSLAKGPKIQSLKYKQRKNEYRRFGHRQNYAQLKITDIVG